MAVLALAVALAIGNLVYQWSMSRKTLDYYGRDDGWLVVNAQRVTALQLASIPASNVNAHDGLQVDDRLYIIEKRADITQAPGIKHIRQALVTDTGFLWPPGEDARPPWRYAISFRSVDKDSADKDSVNNGEFVLLFSEDGLQARALHGASCLRIRPAEPRDARSAMARKGESPFLAFFQAQFAEKSGIRRSSGRP